MSWTAMTAGKTTLDAPPAVDRTARATQPEITTLEPAHEPGMMALYQRHFGRWAAARFAARRRWQFLDNPFTEPDRARSVVAVADGTVIGLTTVHSLPLRLRGGERLAQCAGDFAVDPGNPLVPLQLARHVARYQPLLGAGASPEADLIGRFTGDVVVPISNRSFSFTIRATGSAQRAMRRNLPAWAQWLAIPQLAGLAAHLTPPRDARQTQPLPPRHQRDAQQLTHFDTAFDRLWHGFATRLPLGLQKTARYMNWRYLAGPGSSHEVWSYRDQHGQLAGVLVLGLLACLDDKLQPCGIDGEILELIVQDPDDSSLVERMLVDALHLLSAKRVDTVRTTGLCSAYHAVLSGLGFAAETRGARKLTLNLGPDDGDLGEEAEWYVSAGDGDQLYGMTL